MPCPLIEVNVCEGLIDAFNGMKVNKILLSLLKGQDSFLQAVGNSKQNLPRPCLT